MDATDRVSPRLLVHNITSTEPTAHNVSLPLCTWAELAATCEASVSAKEAPYPYQGRAVVFVRMDGTVPDVDSRPAWMGPVINMAVAGGTEPDAVITAPTYARPSGLDLAWAGALARDSWGNRMMETKTVLQVRDAVTQTLLFEEPVNAAPTDPDASTDTVSRHTHVECRYRVNAEWDLSRVTSYVPRHHRPSWVPIVTHGLVRLLATEPVNARWTVLSVDPVTGHKWVWVR